MTLWVNAVVDSGKQMIVDDLGFLHLASESNVSAIQRRRRAGRVADGLYCRLYEESAAPSSNCLPYPEQQQVCLASLSLGVPWPLAGMEKLTHAYVKADLISMGLIRRS